MTLQGVKKSPTIPFTSPPAYLDRVGQRDGDSKRQPLRDGHHQHCHTNNEELDKVLDVDGGALSHPGATLDRKGVDHKEEDEDDDSHSRHDQTWEEQAEMSSCSNQLTDYKFRIL